MGKWTARLATKTASSPLSSTDETAKRGLLSVLAVPSRGSAELSTAPVQPIGEVACMSAAVSASALAAVAWTDGDIARFIDRRSRLMRWGWPEEDAEALAERLVARDRARDDDRVNCTECRHYRPGRCGNHRAAGLHSSEIGRDLTALLQRCPGHHLAR